jgi:hypothetical protein
MSGDRRRATCLDMKSIIKEFKFSIRKLVHSYVQHYWGSGGMFSRKSNLGESRMTFPAFGEKWKHLAKNVKILQREPNEKHVRFFCKVIWLWFLPEIG